MLNRQLGKFTIVLNEIINNPKLSAKAKGIYLYLQSKPEDWNFYETEVVNNFLEGRDAISTGLKELVKHELLIRWQVRNNGQFGSSVWLLNPTPKDLAVHLDTEMGKSHLGKSATNKTNNTNTNNTKEEEEEIGSLTQTRFINFLRLEFPKAPIEINNGNSYYFSSSGNLHTVDTNKKVASSMSLEIYKRMYAQRVQLAKYLRANQKQKDEASLLSN